MNVQRPRLMRLVERLQRLLDRRLAVGRVQVQDVDREAVFREERPRALNGVAHRRAREPCRRRRVYPTVPSRKRVSDVPVRNYSRS